MADGSGKAREIDLGEDFGAVVVKANGARVEIGADGSVHGLPAPANDSAAKAKTAPEIGDKMEDGTVYAGISPDTNKPMYATPADEPLTYTFNQAQKYAETLDAHGHKDWRAPTKGELNVLFQSRAAIGGFNETGSTPAGWYWSSSPDGHDGGWEQRFSDGHPHNGYRGGGSFLRCVRG